MTRINVIPVQQLTGRHLVAEYREICRLPGNLHKSLNRKTPFCMSEIGAHYTLGTGHVKYFYNKMLFLQKRFKALVEEMVVRGYKPQFTDGTIFEACPKEFFGDYTPTVEAMEINKRRINERLGLTPVKDGV